MAEDLDLEGKVLDARVRQKKDTLANWEANELILLDGEQAFVVDAGGQPINFKIGDGTKKFADLPFWIAYDQGQYVPITGTVLPTPTATVGYSIVPEGTYTRAGQANVVVPAGKMGVLNFGANTWSLGSSVPLPMQQGVPVLNPSGSGLPTEKATADYVAPIMNSLTVGTNLLDKNDIKSGAYSLSGVFSPSTNWIHIIKTGLEKNTKYIINTGDIILAAAARVVFLDLNNQLISSIPGDGTANKLVFTTPSVDFKTAINIANETGIGLTPTDNQFAEILQMNKGETLLPYESYKVISTDFIGYDFDSVVKEQSITKERGVAEVFQEVPSKNLIDKNNGITFGNLTVTNGVIARSTSKNWISYLPLTINGGTYYFKGFKKGTTSQAALPRVIFTDLNDVYISQLTFGAVDSDNGFAFTTPWSESQQGKVLFNIANETGIGEPAVISNNPYSNALMLSKGPNPQDYEPFGNIYKLPTSNIQGEIASENDLDKIIIEKKSDRLLTAYFYTGGNSANWFGVNFYRQTVTSSFIDVWRLDTGKIFERTGEFSFIPKEEIIKTGVWENAIYTVGYPNALGSAHGWEKLTDISILLDGVDFTTFQVGSYKVSTLEASSNSNLLTVDGASVRATSLKTWKISGGLIHNTNSINWLLETTTGDQSFVAMCPVNRFDGATQITNRAMRDPEWQYYDVSKPGFSNPMAKTPNNSSTIVIEGLKAKVEMSVIATPIDLPERSFWVQNTEVFNKLYFQLGIANIQIGDVWNIESKYKINIK